MEIILSDFENDGQIQLPAEVVGDQVRLKQVLINLTKNAL